MEILREITPLTQNDCFTLFSKHKDSFDFPFHTHEEYELNLILQAPGAKRIVGAKNYYKKTSCNSFSWLLIY